MHDEIGDIIRFGLEHPPGVRGVHFQPVSYFGRYPAPPGDEVRITLPEVMRAIETQTGESIKSDYFKPPGCENAYCSFHGNFVLLENGDLRALTWRTTDQPCCKPGPAQAGAVQARSFVSRFWTHPSTKAGAVLHRAHNSFARRVGHVSRSGPHPFVFNLRYGVSRRMEP